MKRLHAQGWNGIEASYDCFQGKHWRKDFRKDRGPGARGCTKSGLLGAFMVLIFKAWRIMVNWETIISVNEKGKGVLFLGVSLVRHSFFSFQSSRLISEAFLTI